MGVRRLSEVVLTSALDLCESIKLCYNQTKVVSIPQYYRCPTKPCQKGKPFPTADESADGSTDGTADGTADGSADGSGDETGEDLIPEIQDQLCIQAGIKDEYYSSLGNYYCQITCLFKPMDQCNLYLCSCSTKYVSSKGF